MHFPIFLTADVRTAAIRFAILSVMAGLWQYCGTLSLTSGLFALLPSPFGFLSAVFSILGYPGMLMRGYGIYTLISAVLMGLQLGAAIVLALALVSARAPHLLPSVASSAAGPLDGRRLARPWFMTPLLVGLWLTVMCYAVTWMFIAGSITSRFRGPVTLASAMDQAGLVPLIVAMGIFVLAMLVAWYQVWQSKKLIQQAFSANIQPDHNWLTQRVHALAKQLDLPPPAVAWTDAANAFACGASRNNAMVVVGVPLIKTLSEEELNAVIGHELGHIVSGDMLRMQVSEAVQSTLASGAELVGNFLTTAMAKTRTDANFGAMLARGARKTLFFGGEVAVKGTSRGREFYADAIGAGLTSPDAMANALRKLERITARRTPAELHYASLMFRGAKLGGLFATHPHTESRLTALEKGTYLRALPRQRG